MNAKPIIICILATLSLSSLAFAQKSGRGSWACPPFLRQFRKMGHKIMAYLPFEAGTPFLL